MKALLKLVMANPSLFQGWHFLEKDALYTRGTDEPQILNTVIVPDHHIIGLTTDIEGSQKEGKRYGVSYLLELLQLLHDLKIETVQLIETETSMLLFKCEEEDVYALAANRIVEDDD